MNRKLFLSDNALKGIEATTASVVRASGYKAGKKHRADLRSYIKGLTINPEKCQYLDRASLEGVRRCVFNRLTIIIYRFNDEVFDIIDIVDARSNWFVQQGLK